jgi:hypothetical protein
MGGSDAMPDAAGGEAVTGSLNSTGAPLTTTMNYAVQFSDLGTLAHTGLSFCT